MIGDVVGKVGDTVTIFGWVNTRRDHGKIMFLDVRDRSGTVQVVSNKTQADTKPEDCVEITGVVKKRPEAMVNLKIATGTVEIEAQKIQIISKAADLPFPIYTD